MQQSTQLAAFFAIAFMLFRCTLASNTIYAWGANDYGQLGLGALENPVREPVVVNFYNDLATVVDIQITASYHFATLDDGTVYTSGNNYYGCLGLNSPTGNNTYTPNPTQNTALTGCSVVASKRHVNALCGSTAYGWGNWAGNVIGATTGVWPKVHQENNGPNQVSGINVVLDGTFITSSTGGLYSAGNGTNGKLALGDNLNRGKLASVNFFSSNSITIKAIYNSQSDHICASATNYSLYCWGNNDLGQLGLGSEGGFVASPQIVPGIEQGEYIISQVAYGTEHTLALSCGGAVLTWGTRQYGVIGDGTDSNDTQSSVSVVAGLVGKNIVEVVAGANSNFARGSDGTWYTWGAGYGGVLGTESDLNVLTPQANTLINSMGINHIVSGASSKSAFGWAVSGVFTTTQNCPSLTDECAGANDCATSNNGVCIDTDRYYQCGCQPGYQGDGYTTGTGCSDIDECAIGTAQCDPNSQCQNTPGSYLCNCASDYHGNGYWVNSTAKNVPLPGQGCILNVDECTNSSLNDCSTDADCVDTIWAYNCSCKDGFTGNGVSCKDINECAASVSPCGANSVCSNTNGSYFCTCNQGFESPNNNGSACQDIDECTGTDSPCDPNAACRNTVGSYVCTCNDGFTGNGTVCTNVNGSSTSTGGSSTTSAGSTSSGTSNATTSGGNTPTTTGNSTTNQATQAPGGTGFPTTGTGGNTLDVNTIGAGDSIAPGSTSTTSQSQTTAGFLVNAASAQASSDSTEKKILVGVFVGFIGLVIIAVAVVVVVVIQRRRRRNTWA